MTDHHIPSDASLFYLYDSSGYLMMGQLMSPKEAGLANRKLRREGSQARWLHKSPEEYAKSDSFDS